MGHTERKYVRNTARIFLTALIATSLVLLGAVGSVSSNNAIAYDAGTRITLQDLGVLQLASHDLYNVNRITEVDTEDETLNLTTLFLANIKFTVQILSGKTLRR